MAARLSERTASADPFDQLARWLASARRSGATWYDAMVLATTAGDGALSARAVLLRGSDRRGLVFFTDQRSRKGRELAADPPGCEEPTLSERFGAEYEAYAARVPRWLPRPPRSGSE